MANRNVLTSGINLPIEIVHSYPMSPPPPFPFAPAQGRLQPSGKWAARTRVSVNLFQPAAAGEPRPAERLIKFYAQHRGNKLATDTAMNINWNYALKAKWEEGRGSWRPISQAMVCAANGVRWT